MAASQLAFGLLPIVRDVERLGQHP